jgi:hypothetical protein
MERPGDAQLDRDAIVIASHALRRGSAVADFKINPNFERDVGAMITAKANEAVAAVGPSAGRAPSEIESALAAELTARGINLPHETLQPAAEAMAAGQSFEFR